MEKSETLLSKPAAVIYGLKLKPLIVVQYPRPEPSYHTPFLSRYLLMRLKSRIAIGLNLLNTLGEDVLFMA